MAASKQKPRGGDAGPRRTSKRSSSKLILPTTQPSTQKARANGHGVLRSVLEEASASTRGLIKPNGERYRNDDENWTWLVNVAGKAARWLGYIPFERITDNRNAEPIIHRKARVDPQAFVNIGIHVEVPSVDDLEPLPFA